jgi:hypothetical protein
MPHWEISKIVEWLHEQHGGHRHWQGGEGLGLAGYRAGPFRVKIMNIGGDNYYMDVLLPNEDAAMQCYLFWA